jgi:serine/threonine-protein kinase RsbT
MKSTLASTVTRNPVGQATLDTPARPLAETSLPVQSPTDIIEARRVGREFAAGLGFAPTECTLIATAISELARNIAIDSNDGEMRLRTVSRTGHVGIALTVSGKGPHRRELRHSGTDRYSVSHGLGLGLPGVKRIMDEFEIASSPGTGTTITVKKWRSR